MKKYLILIVVIITALFFYSFKGMENKMDISKQSIAFAQPKNLSDLSNNLNVKFQKLSNQFKADKVSALEFRDESKLILAELNESVRTLIVQKNYLKKLLGGFSYGRSFFWAKTATSPTPWIYTPPPCPTPEDVNLCNDFYYYDCLNFCNIKLSGEMYLIEEMETGAYNRYQSALVDCHNQYDHLIHLPEYAIFRKNCIDNAEAVYNDEMQSLMSYANSLNGDLYYCEDNCQMNYSPY